MAAVEPKMNAQYPVRDKTVRLNDRDIFYREAEAEGAPMTLLRHVFPTSSDMFRHLIPRFAGSFRLVASDYPVGSAYEEGLLEFWDWRRGQ
jgi:pimeloyl-ACP methyl ester carboxylesterase